MQDNRDPYEPIIATRPSRKPDRDDTKPLWPLVLGLAAGVVVVVLAASWFMRRSSNDAASTTAQENGFATEESIEIRQDDLPEVRLDPAPASAPPPNDAGENSDSDPGVASPTAPTEPVATPEQPAPAESTPAAVPDTVSQSPPPPSTTSVTFTSPDPQVRFEVRGPLDTSPHKTVESGQVLALEPGTYRVVASGPQLEALEREIILEGSGAAEYAVELCAQPKQEREQLAGRIVEERACATTQQCESMFSVLSEYAEQLVNDREFRTQQCAKWRPEAAAEGRWTLDTKCDGATPATTCRIEISQGACSITEPRRTIRGDACPRAELK
jgi:hypothetical protein